MSNPIRPVTTSNFLFISTIRILEFKKDEGYSVELTVTNF